MAARLDGDDDDIIADINVTPLVDITLVLLIIFMVTATYIVAPSIKVNLPKASTGEDTQSSTLSLMLTAEGKLFLNGKEVSEDTLAKTVEEEKAQKPDVQAIIGADKDVSHGAVIHLIDLIKRKGVAKFAINIDPGVAGTGPSDLPPGALPDSGQTSPGATGSGSP